MSVKDFWIIIVVMTVVVAIWVTTEKKMHEKKLDFFEKENSHLLRRKDSLEAENVLLLDSIKMHRHLIDSLKNDVIYSKEREKYYIHQLHERTGYILALPDSGIWREFSNL